MKILEIKPLTKSQIDKVVILDRLCLGGLWTAEGYLREIDSPNSTLLTLNLIELASCQIVGIACLWSILNEAHITLLGIHPDYQQQGFGSILFLSLLSDAIARKLEWATLEVNANNKKAINLYKKFGFEIVGKRKGYYQQTGEDALVLWLKEIQKPHFQTGLSQWQQSIEAKLGNNNYYWRKN